MGLRDKFSGNHRALRRYHRGRAGAWLGGAIEGRTGGGTVLRVPINLGVGALLLVAGHLDLAGAQWSGHLNNLGNGLVGSYVAATGYAFGKRWRETGKLFGRRPGTRGRARTSRRRSRLRRCTATCPRRRWPPSCSGCRRQPRHTASRDAQIEARCPRPAQLHENQPLSI